MKPDRKKNGRPPLLKPDEVTLKTIEATARLHASMAEIAGVLNVSESTLRRFLEEWPEAAEAKERGEAHCKLSARRKLFKLADKQSAAAIFLAKNILGMTDKVEQTNKGDIVMRIDSEDAEV